tara:strand:- start:3035 stop:3304 length:270 start_codon:yes stop_codon:yes gene_type:complete
MAEAFNGTYNYFGRFEYVTNSNAIGLDVVKEIDGIVTGKWGWRFIPIEGKEKQWADQSNDSWYEQQRCIIGFDMHDDLVQSILQVGNRL